MNTAYERLPIFAQNLACTVAGWERSRARFSPYFHSTLERGERSGQSSSGLLHGIQRERLDLLVRRARNHTRFWRDLPPPSTVSDPEEAITRTIEVGIRLVQAIPREPNGKVRAVKSSLGRPCDAASDADSRERSPE